MANKLFVGGLSWDTTEDSLRTLFAGVGTVATVAIITDKFSGKSRGFGFVEMANPDDAQKAIQELNGKQLDGRTIVVNEAKPMPQRDSRGFGGRDSGGGRGDRGRGGFNRRGDRGGRDW
jgi:cold-inducible RNA-binding protein